MWGRLPPFVTAPLRSRRRLCAKASLHTDKARPTRLLLRHRASGSHPSSLTGKVSQKLGWSSIAKKEMICKIGLTLLFALSSQYNYLLLHQLGDIDTCTTTQTLESVISAVCGPKTLFNRRRARRPKKTHLCPFPKPLYAFSWSCMRFRLWATDKY